MSTADIDKSATLALLTKTRDLLSDPEHWTKGVARSINDGGEECFCLAGALEHFSAPAPASAWVNWRAANVELAKDLPEPGIGALGGVIDFNDHPETTHADILALLDRTIERLWA
jgi:hypothetical protein